MAFSKSTVFFALIFLCFANFSYGKTDQALKLFNAVDLDNSDLKKVAVTVFLPSKNQFIPSELIEKGYISAYLDYPAANSSSPNANKSVYLFHPYCGGATDFFGEEATDNSLVKFFRDQNYNVVIFDLSATVNLTEQTHPNRITENPYDLEIIRDIFIHSIRNIETKDRGEFNPENLILVGHSTGGYFANAIAMHFKEVFGKDVDGTIQIDPILPYPGKEAKNFVFRLYSILFNITEMAGVSAIDQTQMAKALLKLASSIFNAPSYLLLYEFFYDHTAIKEHTEWPARYANRLNDKNYRTATCQIGSHMTTKRSKTLWGKYESDLKTSTFPTMIIWGKEDQVFKDSHYRNKYATLFFDRTNATTVTYAIRNAGHYVTAETLYRPIPRTGRINSSDTNFIHEVSDFHPIKLPSYRRISETEAKYKDTGSRVLYVPMLEFLQLIDK